MKPYRPLQRVLKARLKKLQVLLQARQEEDAPLQYMEVKELSERMERARTAAQFAILRYKYEDAKTRKTRDEVCEIVETYLKAKQKYYQSYHRYLQQCTRETQSWARQAANDWNAHETGRRHDER